jgi:phosphopantetheinyl transferase
MFLQKTENSANDIQLGIWKIDERVEDFFSRQPALSFLKPRLENIHSEIRKQEMLAVYSLLFHMTGDTSLRITHNADDKPVVREWNISVSHTRGYAALILSKTHQVGIDIEYYSNRVSRVVSKFIRADEDSSSLDIQLVNWCAKETVYKLFSKEDLQYFEMRLLPFHIHPSGRIMVEDLKQRKSQPVEYMITDAFVLTFAYV